MKLCGCVHWCKIGLLIVLIGMLFIPNFTYSQNLPPVLDMGVSNQHAEVGSAFTYSLPTNAFKDENSDPITYNISGLPAGFSFNSSTLEISGTPLSTGSPIITVNASDGVLTSSTSFKITIHASGATYAAFTMNTQSGCNYRQINFTNLSQGANTYIWTLGNGNSSTLASPSAIYSKPGLYTVTLTINQGDPDEDSYTETIRIYPKPVAGIADVTNPGCEPQNVLLTSNGTAGYEPGRTVNGQVIGAITGGADAYHYWYFFEQHSAVYNTTPPSVNVPDLQGGIYKVLLEVTDEYGCQGTKITNNLFEVYDQPNASFSFAKSDNCAPSLTTFFNNSTVDYATIQSSNWVVNGIPLSDHNNTVSYDFTSYGSFPVSLEAVSSYGCTSSLFRDTIHFDSNNSIDFVLPNYTCLGDTILLNASATGSVNSYAWDIENDNSTESTAANFEIAFNTPGQHPVRLSATFNDGCELQVVKTINLDQLTADFSYNAQYDCNNNNYPVNFTNASVSDLGRSISTYRWYLIEGVTETLIGSAANLNYTFANAGTATIKLVVVSIDGCTAEVTKDISLQQPTVSIILSGDTKGCLPAGPTNFQANFSSLYETATAYNWNFGDSGTGTGANTTHTYLNPGSYSVSVSVSTSNGCTYTSTQNNAVQFANQPIISNVTLTQDPDQCYSQGVSLNTTYSAGTDLVYYLTPTGRDSIINPGTSPYNYYYSFPDTGSYTINVLSSQFGCLSDTFTVSGIIANEPKASFIPQQTTFCDNPPYNASFVNTSSYSDPLTEFFWDFGDGNSSTLASPSHLYNTTGDFMVTLTVTNPATGCSDSYSEQINIYSFDNSPGIITADVLSGCAPLVVNFSQTIATRLSANYAATGFEWDFNNDGIIDTVTSASNIEHTFTNPGEYSIRLVVTSATGCDYEFTESAMIKASGPVANFSWLPTQACLNTDVNFSNTSSKLAFDPANPANDNYWWDFGDGANSSLQNPAHAYGQDSVFSVSLTVTDENNCSSTLLKNNIIDIIPFEPEFLTSDSIFCSNEMVSFQNLSTGSISEYRWDFNGDMIFDLVSNNTNTVSNTYSSSGTYNVTLEVIASNGCTKQYSQTIRIVNASAEFSASSTNIGCAPAFAYFNPVTGINDVESYSWNFGDGNSSSERSPKNYYVTPGRYTVSLTIYFKGGCSKTVSKTNYITVDGAYGEFSYDRTLGCAPNPVLFSVDNMSRVSYVSWDFGTGVIQTDTLAPFSTYIETTYAYDTLGFRTPKIILTDDVCGEYAYDNETLGNIYTSTPPVADFTVDFDSICKGVQIQFSDNSVSNDPNYNISNWKWNFGNTANDSSFVQNPTYRYMNQGIFSPQIIVSNELGCSDTLIKPNSIHIYSNDQLSSDFTISDPLACSWQQITFSSTAAAGSGSNITAYEWNFGDGYINGSANQTYAFHDSLKGQTVPVIQRVTDDKFCTDSTIRTVDINNLQAAFGYDPQPVYRGSLVDFVDQSASDFGTVITAWSWNFENASPGASASQNPQNIAYSTIAPTNGVQLIVTNNNNCKDTLLIDFAVLNNPPIVDTFTITLVENHDYVFGINEFQNRFNAMDPGQNMDSIRIESYPANGSFRLNGNPYNIGTGIATSQISALQFVPAANWNGNTSFTWNARDGIDWSLFPQIINVVVLEEPDPPTLSDIVFDVPEDAIVRITKQDFVNHVSSVLGSSFVFDSLYVLTNLSPNTGTFRFNGSSVNAPQLILGNEINDTDAIFEYTPANGFNGTLSFSWNAYDGYNFAISPSQVVINYYNTAPVLSDISRTKKEDEVVLILATEFAAAFTDVDLYDSPQRFYLTNRPPSTEGEFWYNGQAILSNNFSVPFNQLNNLRFYPAFGFEGTTQATWGISDGTDIAYAQIEITYVNTPPVVHDFTTFGLEDIVKTFAITDFDVANQEFPFEDDDHYDQAEEISIQSLPLNGLLNYNASPAYIGLRIPRSSIPQLSYLGNFDWNGTDFFDYNAYDGTEWAANDSTVYLSIQAVNDAPRPNPDSFTIEEDQTIHGFSVGANDDDPDDVLTVLRFSVKDEATAGQFGIIDLNVLGFLDFNPNQDFNGSAYFIYEVCDDDNACATDTVFINVTPVNDSPVAYADTFVIFEDEGSKVFKPLLNDKDVDGDYLQLSKIENDLTGNIGTAYGTLNWVSTGNLTFILNLGLDTLASGETINLPFNYFITDNEYIDSSIFVIQIVGKNDPPVAFADEFTIPEGVATVSNNGSNYPSILFNDTDPEDDILQVFSVNNASLHNISGIYGTFTWQNNGDWTFSQNLDATDSLRQGELVQTVYPYTNIDAVTESQPSTISIYIEGVNDAPVANNNILEIFEDEVQVYIGINQPEALLYNDSDVDGDAFYVSSVEGSPVGKVTSDVGTLEWNPDGSYTYTPGDTVQELSADASITDIFNYTITDDFDSTATAQLIIIITGLNDAPLASDDYIEIYEDTHITEIDASNGLLVNDGDIDHDPIVVAVNGVGTRTLEGNFGTLTWDSTGAYTYTTKIAIVDTLYEDERVTDVFTYLVNDPSGETDVAKLYITIIGQNDAPVALSHTDSIWEDQQTLNVINRELGILTEDSDIDDNLDFGIISIDDIETKNINGEYGQLDWNDDGTYTYTLNADMDSLAIGEVVVDSFEYIIQDRFDSIDEAVFYVVITGENDDPVAQSDTLKLTEDDLVITPDWTLLDNDGDTDGDFIEMISMADNSTSPVSTIFAQFDWDSTGLFTYNRNQFNLLINGLDTMAFDDLFSDTIQYTIIDNNGVQDTAELILIIQGVNDAPVTKRDANSIGENATAIASNSSNKILDNDYEIDRRDSISLVSINNETDYSTEGQFGTLNWNDDGSYTYLNRISSTDSLYYFERVHDLFPYTIIDLQGATTTDTLDITVIGANDKPVALNDTVYIREDELSVEINAGGGGILANDFDVDGDLITVYLNSGDTIQTYNGSYGKLTINKTGEATYTLNAELDTLAFDEQVTETFNYIIIDPYSGTASAKVFINISGDNDAPIAEDNFVSIDEDTDSIIAPIIDANALLFNDSDIDGDVLNVSTINDTIANPAKGNYGELVWNPSGDYVYVTNKAEADRLAFGDTVYENFNYVVVDPNMASDTAALSIEIIGVNDPPVALKNAYVTYDVQALVITSDSTNDILDNDYDVDGTMQTITLVNDLPNDTITGSWGKFIWQADGSFIYLPDSAYAIALRPDEVNTDQFTYVIEDEWGATDTSLIDFNITGINNGPTAHTDSLILFEDDLTAVLENGLLKNDTDPDRDTLLVTRIENDTIGLFRGFYGEIFWTKGGSVVFTPNRSVIDQLGPEEIKTEPYTYTIVDEGGITSTADLIVKIIGENDPIDAQNDTSTIFEDDYLVKRVVENDLDVDQNIDVSTIEIITFPQHGNASVNTANGSIYYFPDENYSGSDSIQYRICDEGDPVTCDNAWLYITIIEVNDAPVATHLILPTDINTPVSFNAFNQVTDSDDGIDPGTLVYSDEHVSRMDSILTYTPDSNFVGFDEFIYSLSDFTGEAAYVIVNILIPDGGEGAQNDWVSTNENTPVQVKILLNDTLNAFVANPLSVDIKIFPVNGVAAYDPFQQTINYQPSENFNGLDSLTYIVGAESGVWDFATVYIAVEPVNSPIEANDDAKTTLLNQSVIIPVLLNDYDEDNGVNYASLDTLSSTSHGTLSINKIKGTITYKPATDYKGPDSFTYKVCDLDPDNPSCDSATVFILVKTKYDNFFAGNDEFTTPENTALPIAYSALIENDGDEDNKGAIDPSSFTILSIPQHGNYSWDSITNNIIYTPASNYFGPDWMTYQLSDTTGSTDMAEINIWVEEKNSAPVTDDDFYVVTENTTKRLYVLSNDFDYDGVLDWSSLSVISNPANGSVQVDKLTGTLLYTPEVNANTDVFIYSICDNDGACTQDTVHITIDLGSTILYNQITYEDTPDTIDLKPLLAIYNFKDTIQSFVEVIAPNIGNWEFVNNNTQLVYTPLPDSTGDDYYNIVLYFANQDTADLKVTVNVIPVNDAPVALADTITWPNDQDTLTIGFADILGNDYDVDGDSIFLNRNALDWGDSLHISINPDSTISIWADTIFWCDSWFTYQISDPDGEIAEGFVYLMPELEGIIAIKDTVSVDENSTSNIIDVLANDVIKDNQLCTIESIEITIEALHGVAAPSDEQSVLYQPVITYYGMDSVFYTITDIWGQQASAWIVIHVIQRNTPPVAADDDIVNEFGQQLIIHALDNDYDPDPDGWIDSSKTNVQVDQQPISGTVEFISDSGYFVYTPYELTCEGDLFTYTIFDNEGDSASATVNIGLPAEAPLYALTDTVKTYPGIKVEFNVLTNDGGYMIPVIQSYTQPFTGTIEQTGDSTLMFYPNVDFVGNDSLYYELESPCGNVVSGKVIFKVEELKVPEIITPNNDNKNDVLIIDGIEYFPDSWLQIFNRYGHIVYQRKGYENDWDGHSNQGSFGGDKALPAGNYFYVLIYNEGRNNQSGMIYILR